MTQRLNPGECVSGPFVDTPLAVVCEKVELYQGEGDGVSASAKQALLRAYNMLLSIAVKEARDPQPSQTLFFQEESCDARSLAPMTPEEIEQYLGPSERIVDEPVTISLQISWELKMKSVVSVVVESLDDVTIEEFRAAEKGFMAWLLRTAENAESDGEAEDIKVVRDDENYKIIVWKIDPVMGADLVVFVTKTACDQCDPLIKAILVVDRTSISGLNPNFDGE